MVAVAKGWSSSSRTLPHSPAPDFTHHMLDVYQRVVQHGALNFVAARIQLLSNLQFDEWERIMDMAIHHPQDLAVYIVKELK